MIASGKRKIRSGGRGPALLRRLDSRWFLLGTAGCFVWMLAFFPVSSVWIFRIGLSLALGAAAGFLLRGVRDRRQLWAGAACLLAALCGVWLVRPDVAGLLAVAGWLLFLGGTSLRKVLSAPAWSAAERVLEMLLCGAMLLLGALLLVRSGSLDYLSMTRTCIIAVLASALGACAMDRTANLFRKRSEK